MKYPSLFESLMAGGTIEGPFEAPLRRTDIQAAMHRFRDLLVLIVAALAALIAWWLP